MVHFWLHLKWLIILCERLLLVSVVSTVVATAIPRTHVVIAVVGLRRTSKSGAVRKRTTSWFLLLLLRRRLSLMVCSSVPRYLQPKTANTT